ncbi:nitroreductase [Candidatus Pacearchaeota archaeon CG10_big_fil_rev_8_21_14_0_10_35_13]|nr:MAG: nitroreductase [Candidatus Pacearchaeota archaeon CG10_big_fil_rev_8_21_14_0_10_35_13]
MGLFGNGGGFDRLIRDRHSVHNFSDKKLNIRDVLEVIDAANQAPSAGNLHVLKFLIVEDADKISKLTKACQQGFINDSKLVIVVCSDVDQVVRNFPERGVLYSRQQAGAAIQNMLLKVQHLGMATCWVGHFSEKTVRRILKIPKHYDIEAILPLGYELKLKAHEVKKKQPLHQSVFYDEWNNKRH